MEIIGAFLVSLAMQLYKFLFRKHLLDGTKPPKFITYFFLILLSFMAALVYVIMLNYGYWESFYRILLYAAGIYALLLKRFEEPDVA